MHLMLPFALIWGQKVQASMPLPQFCLAALGNKMESSWCPTQRSFSEISQNLIQTFWDSSVPFNTFIFITLVCCNTCHTESCLQTPLNSAPPHYQTLLNRYLSWWTQNPQASTLPVLWWANSVKRHAQQMPFLLGSPASQKCSVCCYFSARTHKLRDMRLKFHFFEKSMRVTSDPEEPSLKTCAEKVSLKPDPVLTLALVPLPALKPLTVLILKQGPEKGYPEHWGRSSRRYHGTCWCCCGNHLVRPLSWSQPSQKRRRSSSPAASLAKPQFLKYKRNEIQRPDNPSQW